MEILEFIRDYWAEHGYSPSYRDIANACELKSSSTAAFHLRKMRDAGLINFDDGITRSIRINGATN